jgi:D-glycero-alpha-D-manno-heptose-7-phosphate kinase
VRVDFAGGGSDVAPFAVAEWGHVVNMAINRYAQAEARRRDDGQVVVISDDLGLCERYPSRAALRHDSPLRLITRAIAATPGTGGLTVRVRTDAPPGAGLGVSAAVSVALLYALRALAGAPPVDRVALAGDAVRLETEGLGATGGGQDQLAAAFGGAQALRFAGGAVTRRALALAPATAAALDASLLLCYSGTAHVSSDLLAPVMRRYLDGDAATIARLRRLREIALDLEAAFEAGDLAPLGPLLDANWAAFSGLHAGISTPTLERIFALAKAAGARGGKATGAGGGGCALLACPPERRDAVAAALQAAGVRVLPFARAEGGVSLTVHD